MSLHGCPFVCEVWFCFFVFTNCICVCSREGMKMAGWSGGEADVHNYYPPTQTAGGRSSPVGRLHSLPTAYRYAVCKKTHTKTRLRKQKGNRAMTQGPIMSQLDRKLGPGTEFIPPFPHPPIPHHHPWHCPALRIFLKERHFLLFSGFLCFALEPAQIPSDLQAVWEGNKCEHPRLQTPSAFISLAFSPAWRLHSIPTA